MSPLLPFWHFLTRPFRRCRYGTPHCLTHHTARRHWGRRP